MSVQPSPTQPQPTASAPTRKRRVPIWLVVVLVVLGLIGALVAAFFINGALFERRFHEEMATATYEVSGPETAWLDPRYAGGTTTWETDDEVVGVALDRSTMMTTSRADGATLGRSVQTGEVVWRVEGLACDPHSPVGSHALCLRETADGHDVVRLDIATGEEAVVYRAPFPILAMNGVGENEQHSFALAVAHGMDGVTMLAFDRAAQDIAWQRIVPSEIRDCRVFETHVGCADLAQYFVLDAATGEPTVPVTQLEPEQRLEWTSDGYALPRGWFNDNPEPVRDFNGADVAQVVFPAGTVFHPSIEDRAHVSTRTLIERNGVDAVDASGRVVADVLFGDLWFYPSKTKLGEGYEVEHVSSDGGVVLVKQGGALSLRDREGRDLGATDLPGQRDARIIDGVITARGGSGTVVHAPAG